MEDAGRRVPVGRIVGLHGVRGEVKVESWTEPRMDIFDLQPWLLTAAPGGNVEATDKRIDKVVGRVQGKGLVARIPELLDRDQASAWVGCDILVERRQLPPTGDDEYYWCDLEALEVRTLADEVLGRVHHVFATGANDVLVVRGGKREQLIPFLQGSVVREVDVASGRIVVDWDAEF